MNRRLQNVQAVVDHRQAPAPVPLDFSFRGVKQLHDFLEVPSRADTAFEIAAVQVPDRIGGRGSDQSSASEGEAGSAPRGAHPRSSKTARYTGQEQTMRERRRERRRKRRQQEEKKKQQQRGAGGSAAEKKDVAEAAAEEERRKRRKEEKRRKREKLELAESLEPPEDAARSINRYDTTIVKMNNNKLPDLDGMLTYFAAFLRRPMDLVWLDLSFNIIDEVDPALGTLSNLVHLNLHGNQIEDVRDVEPLSTLANLKRFTLHANPCAAAALYRETVLTILPWLTHFDFSGVTKGDRACALEWYSSHGKFQVMTPGEMRKLVEERMRAEAVKGRQSATGDSSDEELDDDAKIDPAEEKAALRRKLSQEKVFDLFD